MSVNEGQDGAVVTALPPRWATAPGSPAAREAGCICPVIDNGHGAGYLGGVIDEDGFTVFVTVVGCPEHPEAER